MEAVVAAFNQEKALVGAFSVITNLRMELFQALVLALTAAAELGPLRDDGVQHPPPGPLAPQLLLTAGLQHPDQIMLQASGKVCCVEVLGT